MLEAQVAMIPQNYVTLSDEQDVKNLQKTLDLLDDDDDVTDVWHNWEELNLIRYIIILQKKKNWRYS